MDRDRCRPRAVPAAPTASLLAALLLAACAGAGTGAPGAAPADPPPVAATATATAPAPAAEPATPAGDPRRTRFGIAGISPAHWPAPSEQDWRAFYAAIPALGGTMGTYTDWRASTPGAPPPLAISQARVGAAAGWSTLPLLGFDGGGAPTIDWEDPAAIAQFRDAAVAVAAETRPPYLGVGNEINLLWERDPARFTAFASALPAIADAIRAASPGTRVFTVFQLEALRGDGRLLGGADAREPGWPLVGRVIDAVDLVAFTTYPFLDFEDPGAIPDDYYRAIAERLGAPFALSEIGWPSDPLRSYPASGHGGTPDEQRAFVERLFALTADLEIAFAMWAFAHDLGETVPPAFASLGLWTRDGAPKPALAAWAAGIGAASP